MQMKQVFELNKGDIKKAIDFWLVQKHRVPIDADIQIEVNVETTVAGGFLSSVVATVTAPGARKEGE